MGVPGLYNFVCNQAAFHDAELWRCIVYLDASNLYHHLYFARAKASNCGGAYIDFALECNLFFDSLLRAECSVKLVLDGTLDLDGRKLDSLTKRYIHNLERALDLVKFSQMRPLVGSLAWYNFLQIARFYSNVSILQTPFDADHTIAFLARRDNACVITRDSDFFLFDIPNGVINLEYFRFRQLTNGPLSCEIYKRNNLAANFELADSLLPLIAAAFGNDIEDSVLFQKYLDSLNRRPGRYWKFQAFLRDLSDCENIDSALSKIVTVCTHSVDLEEQIMRCYRYYNLLEEPTPDVDIRHHLNDDLVDLLGQAKVHHCIRTIVLHNFNFLSVVVQDHSKPCVYNISMPLRRNLYALLNVKEPITEVGFTINYNINYQKVFKSDFKITPNEGLESLFFRSCLSETLNFNDCHCVFLVAFRALFYLIDDFTLFPDFKVIMKCVLYFYFSGSSSIVNVSNFKPRRRWLHALAIFQSCLFNVILINQVLGRPFPEPSINQCIDYSTVFSLLNRKIPKDLTTFSSEELELYNDALKFVDDV